MVSPPPFGVYAPVVTFFHEDESIDYETTSQHVRRLLSARLAGLVVHGSNGEAVHLLPDERAKISRHVKTLIQESGPRSGAVIIVGCSAASARETIQNIETAQQAGADYALVLPPSYWANVMTKPVLKSFYLKVAHGSALPILIYNFPGVTSGIDLDSDFIVDLANSTATIAGVKLTCGNLGKLQRISASVPADGFAPFAGKADFLLPGLVAGSNGAISALANVAPKVHVEVLRLFADGELDRARAVQADLSLADGELLKFGISGVKAACWKWFGYGNGRVRAPLPMVDESAMGAELIGKLQEVVELEKPL